MSEDEAVYANDILDQEIKLFVRSGIKLLNQSLKRIIPDVSIIFVSVSQIKSMNNKFRSINTPTDVLSFPSEEDGYLGDIVISKEVVLAYSEKAEVSFPEELKRDILHGLMHLLGFDHTDHLHQGTTDPMLILQETLLKKLL